MTVLALSACAVVGQDTIGVSLTAVNYTDEDYDVVGIARADDPTQLQAMDRVAAYAGSGLMCCVALPEKWRPGLKVVVITRAGTKAKTYQEWAHEQIPLIPHELEVPPYQEAATLWVQILEGGKFGVVVSRYTPASANWPGSIKGWPKPSTAYKRKIWQRDYNIMLSDLKSLERGVKNDSKKESEYRSNIEYLKMQIKTMEASKP